MKSSHPSFSENAGTIRRYTILGARRLSNFLWALFLSLGGGSFFITGLSSYLRFPFLHSEDILFFPQGITMCFYGSLSLFLSLYLWLTILWKVGNGFNEFNKKTGTLRVFRWGFPGKNRILDFSYLLSDIEAVKIEIFDGLNPRRSILIRLKEKKEIPLTKINQGVSLEEIEKQASDLAFFLNVALDDF